MKKELIIKFYIQYRLYIFPAIVALSSLILITFIILPQISKLITDQKKEGDLISKQHFLEVKAQTLENFNAQDLSNKVDYALFSYPSDKDFGTVIGLVQRVTQESGFTLTSISLGNQASKYANSQSYAIKLDTTGPKKLLPILFSNIETSPRLMRIGNIDISSTPDLQAVVVSMNIDVLYSPAPVSFGSIDSPLPEISQKDEDLIAKLARINPVASQPSSALLTLPRGKANPFE